MGRRAIIKPRHGERQPVLAPKMEAVFHRVASELMESYGSLFPYARSLPGIDEYN